MQLHVLRLPDDQRALQASWGRGGLGLRVHTYFKPERLHLLLDKDMGGHLHFMAAEGSREGVPGQGTAATQL